MALPLRSGDFSTYLLRSAPRRNARRPFGLVWHSQAAASSVSSTPALPIRQGAWPRTAWLIAAAFVVAVAVSTILAVRLARMGGELEKTKIASLDWRHRYETEQASAALRSPAPDQPVVGPTFYLNTTRGAEPDTADPANRITVPADSHWVVLALDREVEAGFQSLRANLRDSAGQEVWQQSGLPVSAHEPLSFVLPSELLRSGDYVLTIEGLTSDGRYQAAGRYRFRATKRQ